MRRLGLLVGLALMTGCATAVPKPQLPAEDVSGRWVGTWIGNGIFAIPREELAVLDLDQRGGRALGRLLLDGTQAAESVPQVVRHAGSTAVRIVAEVSGPDVVVRHEFGEHLMTVDFRLIGDRLVGRVRNTETPVRLVLTREQPTAAAPEAPRALDAPAAPSPAPAAPISDTPRATAAVAAPPPPLAAAASSEARTPPQDYTVSQNLKSVYFDFDRADIRPADARTLDANADWLKTHREVLVLIEGHTDERGTNDYNLALGERRAKSAMNYLVANGIPASRISVVSYGEERPACTTRDDECWRQNRRSQFLAK